MLDGSLVSKTTLVLGFYLTIVSLLSYSFKERLHLSQAVIAILVGVAVGPVGLNLLNPTEWANGDLELRDEITFEFTRIVLGVQVLFTGINLPQAYLLHHWRSLLVVLLPLMISMWLASSTLVWLIIPRLSWLESLVVGACITPTDPVLAASVVRGRFAEQHVPSHLRDILAAESGANDGFAFPFIALALHLCKRAEHGWSRSEVVSKWFIDAVLYECFLSIIIGALLGFIARRCLKQAHLLKLVDHESFLAYSLGLTFFVLGAVGICQSDDLLACFVAGNSFTFDNFFHKETSDQSFQDVIDNLLDSSVFIYIGALLPWDAWRDATLDLPASRLILLIVAVLVLRRLPAATLLSPLIPDLKTIRETLFFGHNGPIGVGAIYYVQKALEDVDESRSYLRRCTTPIVFAIVVGSVIVHGFTVPVAKLGTRLSSTDTRDGEDEQTPLLTDINGDVSSYHDDLERQQHDPGDDGGDHSSSSSSVYAEGRDTVVRERDDQAEVSSTN